jgi:Dpy-30 motif
MMLQAEASPSLAANGAATSTTTIDQQFKQRMAEYKLLQENEASTAINYFHQIEIPSITLAISKDIGKTTEISLNTAISIIGPPHNYGMAVDQRRDLLETNEKRKKAEKKEREEMKNAKKEKNWADKQRHCTQWLAEMDHINRERYQQVVRGTVPIEDYLAKNVLPAVQRGLLAMLKCRPKNPIDFLGHFLIDLTNPLTHASQLDVHGQSLKVARR